MKREEVIVALKKEFDKDYGFMKKEGDKLIWNPVALMLWGILLADGNEHKLVEE